MARDQTRNSSNFNALFWGAGKNRQGFYQVLPLFLLESSREIFKLPPFFYQEWRPVPLCMAETKHARKAHSILLLMNKTASVSFHSQQTIKPKNERKVLPSPPSPLLKEIPSILLLYFSSSFFVSPFLVGFLWLSRMRKWDCR